MRTQQGTPLRDRLTAVSRTVQLASAGWPHADEEAARRRILEILAEDPEVHGPALVDLACEVEDLGLVYCASPGCGHVLREVPAIAKCPQCGGQYLKRRA